MNQKMKTSMSLAALAGLTLAAGSAHAATVYNVNFGADSVDKGILSTQPNEITTGDNYVGAAPENTVNSTWVPISSFVTGQALADSTGSTAAGATLTVSGNSSGAFDGSTVAGDKIFSSYYGGSGNLLTVTIDGLSPGASYDLVVYGAWRWNGTSNGSFSQTVGTGLSGAFFLNSVSGTTINLTAQPDTDPADNGAVTGNWVRFTGLMPDAGGQLAIQWNGSNDGFNGFQLINTVPEPTTTALLGLGGLALILRRRK